MSKTESDSQSTTVLEFFVTGGLCCWLGTFWKSTNFKDYKEQHSKLTCALNLSKIIECSLAYCHVPDLENNSCLLLRRDHRNPQEKSPGCFPCYKGELTSIWTLGPTWFSQEGITTHPFANIRWPAAEIQPQQQTTSTPAEKPHNFIMMCKWATCW